MKKNILKIILTTILITHLTNVRATETNTPQQMRENLQFVVQFPINRADIDLDYRSNLAAIVTMRDYFDTVNIATIDSIAVVGSSSPEGPEKFNLKLATQRAQILCDVLVDECNVPKTIVHIRTTCDTWPLILELIKNDANFPDKERTMTILKSTPTQCRLWMLNFMECTEVYQYMTQVTFSQVRNATTILIVYKKKRAEAPQKMVEEGSAAGALAPASPVVRPDSSVAMGASPQPAAPLAPPLYLPYGERPILVKGQKPLFALKTNLLYDAMTLVNASIEIPIGKRWSVALEGIFPWWLNADKQNAMQIYNANLEVKYWLKPRENQKKGKFPTMTGWFLGAYGGVGIYDIEYQAKGYQGESVFSAGLMAGYAHSIGKSLRMEYSLGVGYMQTHYRRYEAKFSTTENQWLLYRQENGIFSWVGPTHAKISLVWMLNRNVKKGGI